MENKLLQRTFLFGVNSLKFSASFPNTVEFRIIRNQFAKCATSIGANYEESQGGSSRADFKNKVKISYREAREANYWLRIIQALEFENEELNSLLKESSELKFIFAAIIKNTN